MNLKKNRYLSMNHFTVYAKLTKYCLSTMLQYKIKKVKRKGGENKKKKSRQPKQVIDVVDPGVNVVVQSYLAQGMCMGAGIRRETGLTLQSITTARLLSMKTGPWT